MRSAESNNDDQPIIQALKASLPGPKTAEQNAKLIIDCQGDGETTCLKCGQELEPNTPEELWQGLCGEHRVWSS